MKVSLHMLTWNGLKYLPEFFSSLTNQTYRDFTIRVLDNGSSDGSLTFMQDHFSQYLVARNVKNLGFATGHNQLVRVALERFGDDLEDKAIVFSNYDLIFDSNCLGTLYEALMADPAIAAVQPKLYRAFAAEGGADPESQTPSLSDVLDTTGLLLQSSWRFVDRGAGEVDAGQYDERRDLIGPAGALFMMRATAVKELLMNGELFDGDFFAYREDCDLALRMRKTGYETRFVPTAKAWHYRGMYGANKRSMRQVLADRRGRSPFTAALATRNQLYFLIKHFSFGDALRYGWRVFPGEFIRLCYAILFEGETRRMLWSSRHVFSSMFGKRRTLKMTQKVNGAVIRSYIGRP